MILEYIGEKNNGAAVQAAKNVSARIAVNAKKQTAAKIAAQNTEKQTAVKIAAKAAKKAAAVRSLPELRRCDLCGKIFKKRTKNQRFCNRGCYAKFMQEYGNAQTSETLCWDCANTNGNACPWFSEKMQPVEGWTAELRETTDGVSYFVIDCPNFCLDKRLVKKGKMTKRKCGLPQAVACDVCGQEN